MKIVAVIRDRLNGDPVAGENVNFRTPAGTIIDTEVTSADGSATLQGNGNPAGLITWDATVSGEQREASARAQRQIGAWFEAELAKSFQGIVSNGVSAGDGDECAVVPGSGRQVIVGTGCIWVLGVPFHFYDDTPLTAAANATGSTRLDRVVLRCDFNLANTTYGMGVLTYVTGTTSLPTLNTDESGTYDYLLADMSAANGYSSFTSGNITDQREIAGPSAHVHVMADITDLAAALALKANLASPTFTGTAQAATLNATTSNITTLAATTLTVSSSVNFPAGGIDAGDIGGGNVSDTEFDYLNGVTSAIQTQLDAKAPAANPSFTGDAIFTADSLNTLLVQEASGTDLFRVSGTYESVEVLNGVEIFLRPTDSGESGYWDASTGNMRITGTITIGGVTLSTAEMATLDGVTSNIQTQLGTKANLAGGTAFTGAVTSSGGLRHTGGVWGFNGESNSGKMADPADIGTGTIDTTWGTTEASILEDIRTNVNDIKTILRNAGFITA